MSSIRTIQRRPLQRTDSVSLNTFLKADQDFKYQDELERINEKNLELKIEDLNHKISLAKHSKEQLEKEYNSIKSTKESIEIEIKADSETYNFTLQISHFQLQMMNNTPSIITNYNKNPISILKLCAIQLCLPDHILNALKTYKEVIEKRNSQ